MAFTFSSSPQVITRPPPRWLSPRSLSHSFISARSSYQLFHPTTGKRITLSPTILASTSQKLQRSQSHFLLTLGNTGPLQRLSLKYIIPKSPCLAVPRSPPVLYSQRTSGRWRTQPIKLSLELAQTRWSTAMVLLVTLRAWVSALTCLVKPIRHFQRLRPHSWIMSSTALPVSGTVLFRTVSA
jgi:hypothetical protein